MSTLLCNDMNKIYIYLKLKYVKGSMQAMVENFQTGRKKGIILVLILLVLVLVIKQVVLDKLSIIRYN